MVVGAHQDVLLADRPFLDYIAVQVNNPEGGELCRDGLAVVIDLEDGFLFYKLWQNKSPVLNK